MGATGFFAVMAASAVLVTWMQNTAPHEAPVHLNGPFYLERSTADSFGVRSHGLIERTPYGPKFYPLPQSDLASYKRLRLEDYNSSLPRRQTKDYEYDRREVIGPYQVEGGRVWFGNQYYDGESSCGVGAFGYFDMNTRKYVMFSPRQVARWEISALLVEPDAVWMGLDHFGEDISKSPGGLVRWDRSDHHIRHYALEFVVTRIRRDNRDPTVLILSTDLGYALFRDGEIQRFRVQKSPNGKETAVRILRFPPRPTMW